MPSCTASTTSRQASSAHLLGRRLYEVMAFWETAEERNLRARKRFGARREAQLEFARIWKQLPKLVFEVARGSRGNARLPVPILCDGSSAQGKGRRPIAVGGALLPDSHSAPAHRRVPLVRLPRGPRRQTFFADHTRVNLELLETRTFSNRVVYLRYRRAEAVALASFEHSRRRWWANGETRNAYAASSRMA